MTNRDELKAAYTRLENYIQRPAPMSPERDRQAMADLRTLGAALKIVLDSMQETDRQKRRVHR